MAVEGEDKVQKTNCNSEVVDLAEDNMVVAVWCLDIPVDVGAAFVPSASSSTNFLP